MLTPICIHVIVSLSSHIERDLLDPILEKYDFDFLPRECPDEFQEKRRGDQCFQPFDRHCDCETPLGIIYRRKGVVTKKELKRLRKTFQSSPAELEEEITRRKELLKKYPETQQWLNFLTEILAQNDIWRINVIIHQQSDPFIIKRTERINDNEIMAELLLNLETDILYEFIKEKTY